MKNNKFFSIIIVLFALVVVAALIRVYSSNETSFLTTADQANIDEVDQSDMSTSEKLLSQEDLDNSAQNFFGNLETILDTDYISPVDWPPLVRVLSGESYQCVQAGNEFQQGGETKSLIFDGAEYCVTKVSEGAAGSQYTQYAYLRDFEGELVALSFSFRFVQCMNYDEPKQSECLHEQENFNITPIIHQFFSQLK
ncbi:MAG: hypothetical protein PHC89_00325 [Candidatus Pacebacteria bacterium]|nr:hypothetical protein [Candidatus Paceibacterota bacterium]